MFLVLESARYDPFIYAKWLNTLDQGECCDALFSLRSRYWLNSDELMVLSALSSIIITDICPN
jgi:hypothetical protein